MGQKGQKKPKKKSKMSAEEVELLKQIQRFRRGKLLCGEVIDAPVIGGYNYNFTTKKRGCF
jgi:hypothetical protein